MLPGTCRANEKSTDLQIRRTKRQIPRTNPRGTFGIWLLVLEIFLLCFLCGLLFILLFPSPGRCSFPVRRPEVSWFSRQLCEPRCVSTRVLTHLGSSDPLYLGQFTRMARPRSSPISSAVEMV